MNQRTNQGAGLVTERIKGLLKGETERGETE